MVKLFNNMDAFHKKLIILIELKREKSKKKIMEQFLSKVSKRKRYKIILTHNNIMVQNIIIKHNIICVIIDWELMGFFSKYWEYFSAVY